MRQKSEAAQQGGLFKNVVGYILDTPQSETRLSFDEFDVQSDVDFLAHDDTAGFECRIPG
jgi:hypothetical protein